MNKDGSTTSQKGLAPIFLLLGILLIGIIAGGIYIIKLQCPNGSVRTDSGCKGLGAISDKNTPAIPKAPAMLTYTNNIKVGYSVQYPSTWKVDDHKSRDTTVNPDGSVTFISPGKESPINVYPCKPYPQDLTNFSPKPLNIIPNNEGGYEVVYSKEIPFPQGKALQFIWSDPDKHAELFTDIYDGNNTCTIGEGIDYDKNDFENSIKDLSVYSKMISTFQFLD